MIFLNAVILMVTVIQVDVLDLKVPNIFLRSPKTAQDQGEKYFSIRTINHGAMAANDEGRRKSMQFPVS